MRKFSHKVMDDQPQGRTKTPILSAVAFAALIFVVYANSLLSDVPLQSSVDAISRELPEVMLVHSAERVVMSATKDAPLSSRRKEEVIHQVVDGGNQNSLIPPFNVTEQERIEWFRKKLPAFKILKSNKLTREFHGRVLEIFNNECEVQFFMTWISPAESFGRVEFMAIDSLFKLHPRGCLVILSRAMDSTRGYRILKPLLDRNYRVAAVTPDLSFLFKNTPAETWLNELKSGNKDPGEIPLAQNLSNLIRLAVLYKYGGVYLDTDFIVLKSFVGLRNSISAQSTDVVSKNWTRLNNAVLIFDMNHPVLLKFMEEFASTFDGSKWGHNGPYLVSRVSQRVIGKPGYNFTVLPPMAFYPADWNRIGGFFKRPANQEGFRWVRAKLLQLSGQTYAVHLWNKKSCRFSIEDGSVLSRLISNHCVVCQYKSSS